MRITTPTMILHWMTAAESKVLPFDLCYLPLPWPRGNVSNDATGAVDAFTPMSEPTTHCR